MFSTGCFACDCLWIFVGGIGLYALRQFIRGPQFSEAATAEGKVAVVTGANSGVGKALCDELNKRGAKVYMVCRDEKRAALAKAELINNGCDGSRLLLRFADLSNLGTIRSLAKKLLEEEPTIDILVNNAGLFGLPQFERTVDGFEKTWQSNYLGHFLFTDLLTSAISKSTDGRIVNVSSFMHTFADSADTEYVNNPSNYSKVNAYNRTKLANLMHARQLGKNFAEAGIAIRVNSCHPGSVNSNILSASGWLFLTYIFVPFFWFFFKTEHDGAQTPLLLALSRRLQGNGLYYSDCKIDKISDFAKDDAACRRLYMDSLKAIQK